MLAEPQRGVGVQAACGQVAMTQETTAAVIAELQVWADKFDELAQEYAQISPIASSGYKGAEFILEQRITELRQAAPDVD